MTPDIATLVGQCTHAVREEREAWARYDALWSLWVGTPVADRSVPPSRQTEFRAWDAAVDRVEACKRSLWDSICAEASK